MCAIDPQGLSTSRGISHVNVTMPQLATMLAEAILHVHLHTHALHVHLRIRRMRFTPSPRNAALRCIQLAHTGAGDSTVLPYGQISVPGVIHRVMSSERAVGSRCSLAWATELRWRWYATPSPGTFLSTARSTSSMADGSLLSRYADWRGLSIRRKRNPCLCAARSKSPSRACSGQPSARCRHR